jgi:uncharacterized protein YhjY with autotransporter beta-barrel domain
LLAGMMASMSEQALADDLKVGNGTTLTTPVATATASNGTPGNITTEVGSIVKLADPGAVATLNSNNNIDHSGLFETGATSGGIGVHVLGGFAGNFTAQGGAGAIINVTGSGTGNYGLLLDGTAPFTGNITLQPGSAVIVYGENSVGVAIDAALNGNLLTGAAIQATGVGTTGVRVNAAISGSYTNSGVISVRGTQIFTIENVDPLSGSGIAIGASITQGFLNAGPVSATDGSTSIGRVTNSSTAPAVVIAPSVSGNVSSITLGSFDSDTARLNFSVLNRGNITASENDVGISTTGMRFGETADTSLGTLLNNGFYNRGSITASSQSDNTLSTTATAVPTDATGLIIGKGATVEAFRAPGLSTAAGGWESKAASGSTTTTILLGADGSEVNGIYKGLIVSVGGENKVVTDYVVTRTDDGAVTSKTLTLASALATAPTADQQLFINVDPANAVSLAQGASDISGAYNGFTIRSGTETRIVSDYTVIYNPATSQPTLRVATIQGLIGTPAPFATPPNPNASSPITISTSNLFNAGSIAAAMTGNKGGVVTAINILPGANLVGPDGELGIGSLTNYGAIDATARTTDNSIDALTAIAINDQSGTLNTIVNHGRISATASTLANGAQIAVAADLSRSSATQRFFVLGTGDVVGDILFGSAPVNVDPNLQNKLIIEGSVTNTTGNVTTVDYATVSGALRATNGGSLDVEVSRLGTGGILRTSNVRATSLTVGAKGFAQFALTQNTGSAPLIETTGNIRFEDNSSISITPTTFLPANGTYTLLRSTSGNNVNFTNFGATAGLGSGSQFPFLFEGTFSANGQPLNVASGNITAQNLDLTLRRKTATELGLEGNIAAIYEPLAAAALGDNEFGAALLTLNSAAEVEAAIATTVPDIAGGMRALTVAMTDQATGVIGSRLRSLLTAPPGTRDEFRFWGQEFYNIVGFRADDGTHGFNGAGQGVSVGVEWGSLESRGRWGAGYTFFSSQEVETHPRDTKTNGDWHMLSAYSAWRINDFYIAPQVNVGAGNFKTRRTLIAGNVGRQASAKTTSYLAAGGATAGYIIDLGNIDIIPTIAVDLMHFNQGSYDEFGGGGMSLQLNSQSQTSVRSFAGVIGQGSYAFNEGAFMPQLLAGWTHEFANDPITIDGSFESSPGSPFHLVGPTLASNKAIGGVSLGYVMRNWAAGFNYDASASRGSLAQSATFSISSRF